MKIIKRNGAEVDFQKGKIEAAISKANDSVEKSARIDPLLIQLIANDVQKEAETCPHTLGVEDIQDMVIRTLHKYGATVVGIAYTEYRYKRALVRRANTTDDKILSLINLANEEAKQENANKNPVINSTQRDYIAGEVSRDITDRLLLPKEISDAHKQGIIHFHDSDYFIQRMHNCELLNLEDILQNGTIISETMIEPPKSLRTASTITSQVVAQVASNSFGGQTYTLAHLAPFVDVSRQKLRKRFKDMFPAMDEEQINRTAEKQLHQEVADSIQTMTYQLLTLLTTNGQTPFVSVFMYLDEVPEGQMRDDLALIIEETLNQRILGVKNEKGVYITPAFPKLLYVLDEDNVREGTKYWYLTKLAAKCTAKRMVPDYISAKIMKQDKGEVYGCMGCRSFLTVEDGIRNPDGTRKFYGRFNQGVVTINLPHVALSSGKDMEKFWDIFEERLELCHRALRCRHERLLGTVSDVAPILWQHGALARLKKGETIDKLLYGGYSTISLGYAGLYECVKYMTGVSHTNPEGKPFALEVMQKLNDKCKEWRAAENIAYSVYGTPLESCTYKFAKVNQNAFGIIEGVTDKNYVSNSYHVHVTEEIDAFTKLGFESEFQKLSPGGAISYVEVPNLQDNIEAVLAVMEFIYDHIMYAELNTKSDYCHECGYDGEIQIIEEDGKLLWECPNCGNRDQNRMNVARRTCGYIGSRFWNQGRTQEIKERVLHL